MLFLNQDIDLSPQLIERVKKEYLKNKEPKILFFRVLGPYLQKAYEKAFNLEDTPKILIHGNPHLDNYSRTFSGVGLGDFDRSRIGPYTWDIIRSISSIDFWGKEDAKTMRDSWINEFFDGYLSGLEDVLSYWSCPDFLKEVKPEKWQLTPSKYISSGEKWSKKMAKYEVSKNNFMTELFEKMLEDNPSHSDLKYYKIKSYAKVPGSMGKFHYAYLLKRKGFSPLIYDIKETYSEEDSLHFKNPFDTQGSRMILASILYAPGLELRMSATTYTGADFWGREIPTLSIKVPKEISHEEQLQLARAIGVQLGKGHYQASKDDQNISSHIEKNFSQLVEIAFDLNKQIHQNYDSLASTWT